MISPIYCPSLLLFLFHSHCIGVQFSKLDRNNSYKTFIEITDIIIYYFVRELSGTYDGNMEVPDYLEATVYNKDEAVIMVGNFADVTTSEQVFG